MLNIAHTNWELHWKVQMYDKISFMKIKTLHSNYFRRIVHCSLRWSVYFTPAGKFDYEAAYSATKITGPLLFGFFSICFSFILINFFLTILMEAFEAVRRNPANQSNDHEVIEYMMKRMKMMLGVGAPPKRKVANFFKDPRMPQYVYIEGRLFVGILFITGIFVLFFWWG